MISHMGAHICDHIYCTSQYDIRASGDIKLFSPALSGEKVLSLIKRAIPRSGRRILESLTNTCRVCRFTCRFVFFFRLVLPVRLAFISRCTSPMIFAHVRTLNVQSMMDAEVAVSVPLRTRSIAFFMLNLCDASGAHVSCM